MSTSVSARCDPEEIAFAVGSIVVTIDDVARALAVHEARGEAMQDEAASAALRQDAKDILDRAFRYAQTRRDDARLLINGSNT